MYRERYEQKSVSQRVGVVAVAVDDELVFDAAHRGDGGGAEAGGDGLGQDIDHGQRGVAAGGGGALSLGFLLAEVDHENEIADPLLVLLAMVSPVH